MFQGLFGNASEVTEKDVKEIQPILIDGEQLLRAFKLVRDLFVFTDRRLILVDRQGLTGKKVEYHSIPYKSITHFSIETAGTLDMDAEMKIYISSQQTPIQREFKRGTDMIGVQKTLAQCIMR